MTFLELCPCKPMLHIVTFSDAKLSLTYSELKFTPKISEPPVYLNLIIYHGQTPYMGSVDNSQSSRCVFSKVCSSRILTFLRSEISRSLSCEGIAMSSSCVSVSNLTLPYSDNFTSPVSCCNMFLDHGENVSSLCTPP